MMGTHGPALDKANRTVRDSRASLLRLLRNPNRDKVDVYALQDKVEDAVQQYTTLLVDTLTAMGYKAYTSSDSHYPMIDECVHVDLGDADLGLLYDLIVWSYSKPRFRVRIVGGWYYEVIPPLTMYDGEGITLGTMQELLNTLGSISTTIYAYKRCNGCYYSTDNYYCGLGKVPTEVCSDRLLTTGG